ncbi:MAG: substrate-binding domain-containing protein, partial [Oscillospiraceae bacterium]|nr:substrate-binding domain-containing protein [Oscillospiraceae bacterium]
IEAIIANQNGVMMANIAGNKNAIGYCSLGSLNETVKAVPIDGVTPSAETVKAGSYAAARPFYVATAGEAQGLAADFIAFILSAEGQAVVGQSYITVAEDAQPYAGERPAGKLVVGGSSSVTPVMEKLKEAYLVINPDATIEIQQSDSSSGLSAAVSGTVDLAMSSRELKAAELESLTPVRIALDGIAIVVHNENPVAQLTSEQVRQIFTGEITAWGDVTK